MKFEFDFLMVDNLSLRLAEQKFFEIRNVEIFSIIRIYIFSLKQAKYFCGSKYPLFILDSFRFITVNKRNYLCCSDGNSNRSAQFEKRRYKW